MDRTEPDIRRVGKRNKAWQTGVATCATVVVAAGVLVAAAGTAGAASPGKVALTLSGPAAVVAGATFSVTSQAVVTGTTTDAAEVDLSYPTSQTAFLSSVTATGSTLPSTMFNGGGGGKTMYVAYTFGAGVGGTIPLSTTRFRAGCTAGTATLGYLSTTGFADTTTADFIPTTETPKSVTITAAKAGAVCAQPSIAGQNSTARAITVTGAGFATGTTVSFGPGITTTSVAVVSATKLVATIAVSATATLGDRGITIKNTNGSTSSCSACFTVLPKPAPTSLDTATVARGTTLSTSLRGAGVTSGAKVTVAGTGVTTNVGLVIPGRIDLTITATTTATTSTRTVTVTNPDGGVGTCVNCLTVS